MGHGNLVSVCVSYARIKTCNEQEWAPAKPALQAQARALPAIYSMPANAQAMHTGSAQTPGKQAGKGRAGQATPIRG